MRLRTVVLLLAGAAIISFVWLALRYGTEAPGTNAGGQPAIVIRDGRFAPNRIDVRVGQTVVLRVINEDSVTHDLYLPSLHMPGLGGAQAIVRPQEVRLITLRFDAPGVHAFECSVAGHSAPQMTGAIFVQP